MGPFVIVKRLIWSMINSFIQKNCENSLMHNKDIKHQHVQNQKLLFWISYLWPTFLSFISRFIYMLDPLYQSKLSLWGQYPCELFVKWSI